MMMSLLAFPVMACRGCRGFNGAVSGGWGRGDTSNVKESDVIPLPSCKRCSAADAAHFMGLLESLPVDVDPETGSHSMAGTLALARGYGLTSYDAAYLELAMRANLPLATLDKELRAAAKKAGVKCLPERV